VHGWACDRTYWKHQVEHFSKSHTVVALDLAGHGESGIDRKKWSMEAFGLDVTAVIEKLELEEVILVGHSMGGSVCLEAAARLAEHVTALVPVDTFFDVEQKLSRKQANRFLSPFRIDFTAAARSYIGDNMFTPGTDPLLEETIITDMSHAPPDVALGALEELLTYDTPSALGRIHIPIRCINSDKYITRIETARKYASAFDVSLVPGTGHFLMMEKPDAFNRVLSEVVKDLVMGDNSDTNPRGT
jgi:pimeloyl-ACP methyl ester carboxylesterase